MFFGLFPIFYNELITESFYKIYKGFKNAKDQDRNTIWKFILSNLYRPYFFKNQFDIVIGNIIGSNILNLVIIVPIIGIFSSAIMPIELWERDSSPLIILTLAFTLIMLFLSRVQMPKYLGTLLGFGFISFYMVYVLNLSNLISIF